MPASARLYADTRFFDCTEARELAVVDSTTVTTVMLSTTVTPSANTSAKPRSSVASPCSLFSVFRRSLFMVFVRLDSGAVPEEDRVLEPVCADRRALDAHGQVDAQRCEAAAADHVCESGERRPRREVLRDANRRTRRAARRPGLAVEIPPRRAGHCDRAPRDVTARAARDLQRHR